MTRSQQHRNSLIAGIAIMAGLFILLVTAIAARAQTFRVLHTFTGKPDGSLPYAGLVRDGAGNLYGTTYQRRRKRMRYGLRAGALGFRLD